MLHGSRLAIITAFAPRRAWLIPIICSLLSLRCTKSPKPGLPVYFVSPRRPSAGFSSPVDNFLLRSRTLLRCRIIAMP
jgi:hypothetical protein